MGLEKIPSVLFDEFRSGGFDRLGRGSVQFLKAAISVQDHPDAEIVFRVDPWHPWVAIYPNGHLFSTNEGRSPLLKIMYGVGCLWVEGPIDIGAKEPYASILSRAEYLNNESEVPVSQ